MGDRYHSSWFAHSGLLLVLIVALYTRFPDSPAPYLWLDEAWRAYLIVSHDSLQSSITQSAQDRLFLLPSEWVCGKVGLWLFGKTELAFRLWPLLFSLLGIIGVYCFVAHVGTRSAGVLAALLIAVGPEFIMRAREFKPYALDLALSAWVLYAAVRVPWDQHTQPNVFLLFLLTLFSLCSLAFVFVFPAVLAYRFRERRPQSLFDFALILVPLSLFATTYAFVLQPQQVEGVQRFWAAYLLESIDHIPFVAQEAVRFIGSSFVLGWPLGVLGYFVALPVLSLRRRDGIWLLLLIPFLVQLGAAVSGVYPIFHRPSYYLYGLIVITFGYVVGSLTIAATEEKRQWQRILGAGTIVAVGSFLAFSGASTTGLVRAKAWPVDQGRQVFTRLADEFRYGDKLLMNYGVYFTFLFYQAEVFAANPALLSLHPVRRHTLNDRSPASLCQSFKRQSTSIVVGDRVWFVTTHIRNAYQHYVPVLSSLGTVTVVSKNPWQGLILLEVQASPAQLNCP